MVQNWHRHKVSEPKTIITRTLYDHTRKEKEKKKVYVLGFRLIIPGIGLRHGDLDHDQHKYFQSYMYIFWI